MSIRGGFLSILFFSLALLAGAVSLTACKYAGREAEAAFADAAAAQMDRIGDIIHTYLRAGEQTARNVAALPEAREAFLSLAEAAASPAQAAAKETALLGRLEILRAVAPGVEAVFFGFKNGAYFASPAPKAEEGHDPRLKSWYSDTAWGSADTSVGEAYLSSTGKGLAATVAARIKDDGGNLLGVAALELDLSPLTDTLRDVGLGRSGYLALFDAKGRVLLDPKAQENLMLPASDTKDPALLELSRAQPGALRLTRADAPCAAFVRSLGEPRWKAAILMEEAEYAWSGQTLAWAVIRTAAAACFVLAGLGALLAFAATRPLQALIRQSEALADGYVDALEGIPGRGPDITALHSNLGRMTGRIILLLQTEKEKAEEITRRSQREAEERVRTAEAESSVHAASVAQYRRTAEALLPLARETAEGAADLKRGAAALEEAGSALLAVGNARDMAATLLGDVALFARHAGEMEKSAGTAAQLAKNGQMLAQDTARALETAGDALSSLQPGLETLKSGIAEMREMVGFARGLAEQANLLGLSVSMAAAGGREENPKTMLATEQLQRLAEEAMTQAGSIESAVSALDQSQAAHALVCNKSAATARRAFSLAAKFSEALARITEAAATAAEQARVLATSLEGTAALNAANTETADRALRLSRETEEALRVLRAATEALSSRSEALAAAAEELDALSRQRPGVA